jgi:predicted branched-subunit amino acid permease
MCRLPGVAALLPIVGAARTPTRLTILVMLGVSMLLVMAVQHLTSHARHPRFIVAGIGALLLFELIPPAHALLAEIPAVTDRRRRSAGPPLSLPFDGTA